MLLQVPTLPLSFATSLVRSSDIWRCYFHGWIHRYTYTHKYVSLPHTLSILRDSLDTVAGDRIKSVLDLDCVECEKKKEYKVHVTEDQFGQWNGQVFFFFFWGSTLLIIFRREGHVEKKKSSTDEKGTFGNLGKKLIISKFNMHPFSHSPLVVASLCFWISQNKNKCHPYKGLVCIVRFCGLCWAKNGKAKAGNEHVSTARMKRVIYVTRWRRKILG